MAALFSVPTLIEGIGALLSGERLVDGRIEEGPLEGGGQRVRQQLHDLAHLRTRLLSFDRSSVLVDHSGDERIGLVQDVGDVEADDALDGSPRPHDLGERGPELVALVRLGNHFLTKNQHCSSSWFDEAGYTNVSLASSCAGTCAFGTPRNGNSVW